MKNVLVLYNGQSMYTPTVQDYVEAFARYSKHNVHYLQAGRDTTPAFALDDYDILLITYSCRLCYLERTMSPAVRRAVREFRGVKAAFVQDEYQETNALRRALVELGVTLVFTCVPDEKIPWVYPPGMFAGVRFVRVLTGYVPDRLRHVARQLLPTIEARPNLIGYRGRQLDYCWGDLAHYKVEIGKRFKAACESRGVTHDIAWTEDARIYEDEWYSFIASCRATLGTPSGCNVFDWDGSLEREFRELIRRCPELTFSTYRPTIAAREREIDMGQVSPRMFEAAALGTVLVLLESDYGDILTPDLHYISVKPDFSNIHDVIDQLQDNERLTEIADAAHRDLIASERWSYERFIAQVDAEVDAVGGAAVSRMQGSEFRPAKAYDQSLLEEHGLKSATQYPLTRWLDLSDRRLREPGHEQLFADILDTVSFAGAARQTIRQGARDIAAMPQRARNAFDVLLLPIAVRWLPERIKRPLRALLRLGPPRETVDAERRDGGAIRYSPGDNAPIQQPSEGVK
jgi:hypothetical protein